MTKSLLERAKRFFGQPALAGLEYDSDLLVLGSDNLRYMVRYLRSAETQLSDELGQSKDTQALFDGGPALLRSKQGARGPGDIQLVRQERSSETLLVPTNETHDRMKKGDTTLNACGWCAYQGSGTFIGTAMAYGDCGLLRDLPGKPQGASVKCGDACKVVAFSAAELKALAASAGAQAAERKALRNELRAVTSELRALEAESVIRPVLPGWRKGEQFNVGDRVVVWLRPLPRLTTRVPFMLGRVEGGFRHQDGVVNVRTDLAICRDEYKEGCGVTAGVHTPNVVSLDDFWELRSSATAQTEDGRRFVELWVGHCKENAYGYDMTLYARDLREGQISGR